MKNILVATDFSQAAHNACAYAVQLARVFNARIILFSAYQQLPVPVAEAPAILTSQYMEDYVKEQLGQEAALINRGHAIRVETVCLEGLASNGVLATAQKYGADIIIAGMKDSGKGIRKLFGSTVTSLARRTSIPLIVVPAGVYYHEVNAIALANETDIDPDAGAHHLDMLREITEAFGSRLYLVRVAAGAWQLAQEAHNEPLGLEGRLWQLKPEYKCIEGKDIPVALNRFIACYHIDMLALLPHRHSLMESWFVRSTTKSVIFEAKIPLLILPDKPGNAN